MTRTPQISCDSSPAELRDYHGSRVQGIRGTVQDFRFSGFGVRVGIRISSRFTVPAAGLLLAGVVGLAENWWFVT